MGQGYKILPGVTGDSQIDTKAFPYFPSDRCGSQHMATKDPTSSRDGVYVLRQK